MRKKCKTCGVTKSITEYYKQPLLKDGLFKECKDCCKLQAKKRYSVKRKDPVWYGKEKIRGREFYHRLYKGHKSKPDVSRRSRIKYLAKYPERIKASRQVAY